ncbi:hypothetical protein [Paenibacillus kribbensis]|uniref:hypothetical protein n=1 Tax=Paenibacillus kribbensis TaxID=172713 RepID=UPI001C3FFF36|nr:hypothetical protein [Paenibacillus kribbensis]
MRDENKFKKIKNIPSSQQRSKFFPLLTVGILLMHIILVFKTTYFHTTKLVKKIFYGIKNP